MKKFILVFFLLFIISLNYASGISFSPSSLTYKIEQNTQTCKNITLTSNSEKITITDTWAENKETEWKTNLFDKTAQYHNLTITYDKELTKEERILQICITGETLGEYHGAIILEEQKIGNSIIQAVIWMKVNITEKLPEPEEEKPITTIKLEKPQPTQNTETQPTSSGGGGGGSYTPTQTTEPKEIETTATTPTPEEETPTAVVVEENQEQETDVSKITGAASAPQTLNTPTTLVLIIFTAAIAIVIAALIIKRKKHT